MAEQGPFNYQKSWTVEKPSSETHQWSFQKACESAQSDIETRWGVDYRITQVRFEDNNRTTKTENKPGRPGRWRCTHTVTATYHVERRGTYQELANVEKVTEELKITYVVLNELHAKFLVKSEHEEVLETED